jgi:large subunit ribosomal protein L25
MNTAAKLDATLRTKFGKGASRQDRMKGRTPAVIYGHGAEARHITVDAHEVAKILRHKNAVIDLNLDGKVESVLVKSATKDPVTQVIEHIDLVGLVAGERVHVEVPVHVVGESLSGTVIDLEHKTVKLEVAATSIPDFVEAIFDKQGAGFHVLAKDLVIPAGAKLELAADELIASVVATAAGHAAELAAPAAE